MTDIRTVDLDITDFTEEQRRIPFRIYDQVYECAPDLPALVLIEFAAMAEKAGSSGSTFDDSMKSLFVDMFQMVLTEESAERFIAGMRDKQHPITLTMVMKLMPWVLEQFGMRPTEPSDSSSGGSPTPTSGLNSTASAPLPERTYVDFASTGS